MVENLKGEGEGEDKKEGEERGRMGEGERARELHMSRDGRGMRDEL